jgi:hypothetical protein
LTVFAGANDIVLLNVTGEGGDQALAFGAYGIFLAGAVRFYCEGPRL